MERVQEISEDDAKADGVEDRLHFIALWDELYGPAAFVLNPLVWEITFKRITP